MAKVHEQAIPPALTRRLDACVQRADHFGTGPVVVKARPRISARQPATPAGALGYFAEQTRVWFRDNWRTRIGSDKIAAFALDRAADVLGATFPPEYWRPCEVLEDLAELGRPAWVLPSRSTLPDGYWDAAHRPSRCPIGRIADTYPTPADLGTPDRPAPGWSGAVEDKLFRDNWHVQRRCTFALQVPVRPIDRHPCALKLAVQVHATASRRGSASWFVVTHRPTWWSSADAGYQVPEQIVADWVDAHVAPFELAPETGSEWTQTVSLPSVRNSFVYSGVDPFATYDRVAVRTATPPSLGRYYMRNDWVAVRWGGTIALYQARTPHD